MKILKWLFIEPAYLFDEYNYNQVFSNNIKCGICFNKINVIKLPAVGDDFECESVK